MKMTHMVSKLWRIPIRVFKTLVFANEIERLNSKKTIPSKRKYLFELAKLVFTQFPSLYRFANSSKQQTFKFEKYRNLRPCVVLGNGPSLTCDISAVHDISQYADIACVNDFAITTLYDAIRPQYYIFADPCWWEEKSPENIISRREAVFSAITKCTIWQLSIFVPYEAAKYFSHIFLPSSYINLRYFNTDSCSDNSIIAHPIYDIGLAMPFCQNVLVAALFLVLRLDYKLIVLLGADHSWHESLALDVNNRVCMKNQHFYDKESTLTTWSKDGTDENIWSMSELFHALGRMFEGYSMLEKYAHHLNAKIYNASSVTFIDAFQRRDIATLIGDINKLNHNHV